MGNNKTFETLMKFFTRKKLRYSVKKEGKDKSKRYSAFNCIYCPTIAEITVVTEVSPGLARNIFSDCEETFMNIPTIINIRDVRSR